LLAQELKRLKLVPFDTFSRGCWVETDLKGMYQINLWSRLANKVYIQLVSGEARTFDQLFDLIKKSDYPQRTNNTNITLKVNIQSSQLSSQRTVQSVAHKALLESIARIGKQQENTEKLSEAGKQEVEKRFCVIINSEDFMIKTEKLDKSNIKELNIQIEVPENIVFLQDSTKKERKNAKNIFLEYLPIEKKIKLKKLLEDGEKIFSDYSVNEIL